MAAASMLRGTPSLIRVIGLLQSKHQAKRTVGKSVTHKVGTPVRMYTKENAQRLPGFGNSSSFESVFKAKIGPVGSVRRRS